MVQSIFVQCQFPAVSHLHLARVMDIIELLFGESKKQTDSRSSLEEEYKSLSSATCELQCILYLLKDFDVTCTKPRFVVF